MTLYLNLGINVADIYKDLDKTQLKQVQEACAQGFTTEELNSLEEDGIDVSLIKDNAVKQPPIEEKETDSQELKDAKAQLKEINKKILNNSTELKELEADIILLEDEVNTEFEALVDKQKNLEEKQKEEIKEAQAKVQEKFASSEGEMTEEDYQNSLGDEMDKLDSKYGTKFSSIAVDFAKNNKKAAELNTKINTQSDLISETEDLKTEADKLSCEIRTKQAEHDAALKAEAENNGGGGGPTIKKQEGEIEYPGWIEASGSEALKEAYAMQVNAGVDPQEASNNVMTAQNIDAAAKAYSGGTQAGYDTYVRVATNEALGGDNPHVAAANAAQAAAKETVDTPESMRVYS